MSEGRGTVTLAAIVALAAWAATSKPVSIPPESQRPKEGISHQTDAAKHRGGAQQPFPPPPPEVKADPKDKHSGNSKAEKENRGMDWPAWIEAIAAVIT